MRVITWCGCSSESVRRPRGSDEMPVPGADEPRSHRYRPSTLDQPVVESTRGAVLVLLPVRFPVPLAGPGVRSTHRALHGFAREVWLRPGVGIVPRIWRGTTLRETMTLFTKQL